MNTSIKLNINTLRIVFIINTLINNLTYQGSILDNIFKFDPPLN